MLIPPLRRPACLALTALLLALGSARVSAAGPNVGDAAPSLSVETLLNTPEGASAEWKDLKGKVVVVDFWATWCAPCIASIPHLNELTEQFADEDVVFISLTAEPAETVAPFLKRRPISGWVALDTDSKAGAAWGVTGIPHTFIIGKDGKILGDLHPSGLNAQHIEKALRGEDLGLAKGEASGERVAAQRKAAYGRSYVPGDFPGVGFDENPLPKPITQIVIRKALNPDGGTYGGTSSTGQTWVGFDAAEVVKQAYGRAHGIETTRVEVAAELPEEKLDVAIWTPAGDKGAFRRFVEVGLGAAFNLDARTEEREVEALVLRATDAAEGKLAPTVSTGGSSTSTRTESDMLIFSVINQGPATLARMLENQLHQPVIDETGLTGGYDFEFTLAGDLESAQKAVGKLGLTLEAETRTLTFLVVKDK